MRTALLILALVALSLASAQRCVSELRETAAGLPEAAPEGLIAAELLADAVRLVEPALPPLAWSASVPLQPGDEGFDAVRYLAERTLLPDAWSPEGLTSEAWAEMLSRFLAWYGLSPPEVARPSGAESLIADLALALERVSESVRPLALIAGASGSRSEIAFLGVVWNWTVYPRLIVRRPGQAQTLEDGFEPLLAQLGNCAVRFEHYVYAPEQTARSLFLTHSDSRMYVIGSEPELQAWPLLVPDGQEAEYFSFGAPQVSDLVAYAAAFDGPRFGVRSLMALMPRLRTNLPPNRIPALLQTPLTR
jgi:hypothetical protein